MTAKEKLIPTRTSLFERLKGWGHEFHWQPVFNVHWRLIYQTALAAGLNDAEAQDVVQETIIAVCKKMPSFQYQAGTGSFKNWLLRLTHWCIALHHLQHRRPSGQSSDSVTGSGQLTTELPEAPADAEERWNREWEKHLVSEATERVRLEADALEFQIFDLRARQNWPVRRIVQTLKINRARIYLARHRIKRRIRQVARNLGDMTPRTMNQLQAW